jgi:RecA-family ATPase
VNKEKKTALSHALVGASAKEPPVKTNNVSIANLEQESNDSYNDLLKELKKMQRENDPNYLNTVSMQELYSTLYRDKPPVIDGLLYAGTYLFAGSPKVGKSFLMAQLSYHVSMGIPLWGYPVHQGTVLYLALEDDYRRLQQRFYRMFGTESAECLHLAVNASKLDSGLENQIKQFLSDYPDTKLVIIDTLQRVRELSVAQYSYANDYEIIGKLKAIADNSAICLLLVHHTRKQQADDSFDMISGTNGLLGSADGAFLLHKTKRIANQAILEVSGRDQQEQQLHLIRDERTLCWNLERAETELWKEPPDPVVDAVAGFINEKNPNWEGNATELVRCLGQEMLPHILTMRLNVNVGRLRNEYNIFYSTSRSHAGRKITLRYLQSQSDAP